jgi:hypothetical protein
MSLSVAQDYINLAFRRCGQMRPGYTVSAELYADGMNEWQALFDSWSAERSMGFSVPQYTYPVTGPGSQSSGNGYQIGPSAADWVGPRPEAIIRANLKFTSAGAYPVYMPIKMLSAVEWANLSIRQMPGVNVTSMAYYDPQFPNGVFNVFPPLTGNSIELFTWPGFTVPATPATAYSAPPGYIDAVVWSLAERLWPLCTKAFMPNKLSYSIIAGKAKAACEKVRNVNRPIPILKNDFRGGSRGHIEGYYDSFVSYTGLPT